LIQIKPFLFDFTSGPGFGEYYNHLSKRFIDYIIEVINGRPVNNEIKNYREISIFKTGVTL